MSDPWTLEHAIEIAKIGKDWRSYDGTGGVWIGMHDQHADITFHDWGLARATSIIMNAVRSGRLVPANEVELWKGRCKAERRAHDATIRSWNKDHRGELD